MNNPNELKTQSGRRVLDNGWVEVRAPVKTATGKQVGVYRDVSLALENKRKEMRQKMKRELRNKLRDMEARADEKPHTDG